MDWLLTYLLVVIVLFFYIRLTFVIAKEEWTVQDRMWVILSSIIFPLGIVIALILTVVAIADRFFTNFDWDKKVKL